jgi:hypothetical protein
MLILLEAAFKAFLILRVKGIQENFKKPQGLLSYFSLSSNTILSQSQFGVCDSPLK